ncbi:Os03g0323200 [Oryza sativa Japonica Group]|uniref:Os03g0323200 protein n=1 Tax=Oryza sativa subsp. japonica TaxID=39947 RepID=A0A0P0VWS7_ORYSJ|nr:Os03g0323200 [Oryza sativa Japonica Group]
MSSLVSTPFTTATGVQKKLGAPVPLHSFLLPRRWYLAPAGAHHVRRRQGVPQLVRHPPRHQRQAQGPQRAGDRPRFAEEPHCHRRRRSLRRRDHGAGGQGCQGHTDLRRRAGLLGTHAAVPRRPDHRKAVRERGGVAHRVRARRRASEAGPSQGDRRAAEARRAVHRGTAARVPDDRGVAEQHIGPAPDSGGAAGCAPGA